LCDGTVYPGEFAAPNDRTVASRSLAWHVLEAAAEAGVWGVLFTGGGEPTIWEPLWDALRHSTRLGMANALYTNAFQLGHHPGLVEPLLAPVSGLAFIRLSINAVTPGAIKVHWGLDDPSEVEYQFAALDHLLGTRGRLLARYEEASARPPAIQVSTVVDKNTVADLPGLCLRVAEIARRHSYRGDEDVMVVRPTTVHGRKGGYRIDDHPDWVIQDIIGACGRAGPGRGAIEGAGYRLFLGFGLDRVESGGAGSYAEVLGQEYSSRDRSLANGLFLTVGPDGSAYPTTETNCDPAWALGSLQSEGVAEIYRGHRRREVLDLYNAHRWGPRYCQATSRLARLDRIARAVNLGEITDEDIEQIRSASLASHRLLLD
jgi:hypothetical protein